MKKILITSLLLITSVLAIFAQQSDNATLQLRGNVPVIVNVSATQSAQAESLTMSSAGAYIVEVGTLQYRSNTNFSLSASSLNGTEFVLSDTNGNTIPYTVLVNGTTYSSGENILSQGRTQGDETIAIEIEYTIDSPLPEPGEYQDTLSFDIQGN